MRFKGTSALFIVFVALGLFVYFTEFRNREAREQAEEARKKAIPIEEKNISEISLIYPGLTITGSRNGETNWQMTEPAGVEPDPEEWNQIAANIPRIEREETVTSAATDLKAFGLDVPLTRLVAKTSDGKSFELLFGNENPRKVHNYAKFADSEEVFLTPNSWPRLFQKTVNDLRNKKLLAFASDDVDSVKIEAGRNQVEIQKSGTNWLLRKPIETRADNSEATTFISTVQFARAQSFADPPIDLRAAGLDEPAIRLTLHDGKANIDRVLLIGKEAETDKYYARDAGRDTIFIIDKEIPDKARRPVLDWRDKSIAQIQRDNIEQVEIQSASASLSLKKNGADWQLADGRKLAWDKVSSMLNTLEFEKALGIIDAPTAASSYGLDKPRLEVRFRQGTNELLHLAFGSDRTGSEGIYLKTSADPAVRIVSKDVFDKFNVKAEDLVESQTANP
jgi:hypothetical protein